ncbi:MAG TPA: hypothetical protein VK009_28105 [Chloroflexota bacterium]|nr:hypothetical protein [Chloroflexota bacterium]
MFLGRSPLCAKHYCEAIEALSVMGVSPREFEGDALDLILLERVREDVRLAP